MRYVAAYMLAAMGAKHHHITPNDIENILGSVGVECEHAKAEIVVKKMHGKTLEDVIAEGYGYLSALAGAPSAATTAAPGGSPAAAGATPADAKGGAPEADKKEEKKKEKEKEEESDEDLGFGLFE